jgi:hypothetical protein
MPFMKGHSGNPEGRRVEPRPWQEALRLAVHDVTPDGRQRLRAIAEKVVEQALAGDLDAIREIGNRLRRQAEATGGSRSERGRVCGGPCEHPC